MSRKIKIYKYICSWSIVACLLLINILLFNQIYQIKNSNQLTPRYKSNALSCYNRLDNFGTYSNITQDELKLLIDDEFDTFYIYKVDDSKVDEYFSASSNILYRTVYMRSTYDNDCGSYRYGLSLAHELVHIKYQTSNETWVSFQTFKILYESNSVVLHDLGLYAAACAFNYKNCCKLEPSKYQYMFDYEISYYVAEYLGY